MCTVYEYTVYGVLFSPLWLKSGPGWPAISVSSDQQSRVGQIVWHAYTLLIYCLCEEMLHAVKTLRVKNQVEGPQELFQHFDARCLSVADSGPTQQYELQ